MNIKDVVYREDLYPRSCESFRVKELCPVSAKKWTTLSPDTWAKFLVRLRDWSAAKLDYEFFGTSS